LPEPIESINKIAVATIAQAMTAEVPAKAMS
jgi:hypothetical protein